jgi:hypothetical protein
MYDMVVPPVTVIGQVVYLESDIGSDPEGLDNYYVAVADETTDRHTGYEISRGPHDRLRYGSWLRLQVPAKLGSPGARRDPGYARHLPRTTG